MSADFSAMLRRLKRNEAAKAERRDRLLQKRKKLTTPKGYSKVKAFDFPEVSTKELGYMKAKIRRTIQRDKQKHLLLLLTLSIIAIVIIVHSVDFSETNEIQTQELAQDNFLSENINEYSFLIDDGDHWIQQRRWSNAIYRYEQAVQLFPHSYEANYRLALAYKYHCEFNNNDCGLGEKLTAKLLKYHPDEKNLINLKVAFQTYAQREITTKKQY